MNPNREQLDAAPWMRVARDEIGVREVAGEQRNSDRVLDYLRACKGPRGMLQRDSTSWCAAFVAFCLHSVGIASTRSLAARSYLRYGQPVELAEIRYGDILVFWRGLPLPASVLNAPGHVAFFDRWSSDGDPMAHGGNQGNRVSIVPYARRRLLAIRRPLDTELAVHDLMAGDA